MRWRLWLPVLLVVVVVGGMGAGFVGAQEGQPLVRGSPDLNVHTADSTITPGETNTVSLQISNDGTLSINWGPPEQRSIVTTARNVRVEATADSPLTVETDEIAVGSITEDQPRDDIPIAVRVPDDIEAGTYDLDVELTYAYTRQVGGGVTQDRTRTVTETLELEVEEEARFRIVNATTDAQVGDRGTLSATIENIGEEPARNIDVGLESTGPNVVFGDPAAGVTQSSTAIPELDSGEQTTIEYDISILDNAPVRNYTLDATVQFETPDGQTRVDEYPSARVTPIAEQRFAIEGVNSDLFVGEDGTVQGTVTNTGPTAVENAVVRVTEPSETLVPLEPTVAVGTLEVGESAEFELPFQVTPDAEPVDRPVDLAVQYRNQDFEQRVFDDLELLTSVGPEQRFSIESVEGDLYVGEEGDIHGVIVNDGPQESRNVAVVYTEEAAENLFPIERSVAVGTLDAGESTTFRLPIDVGGEAEPVDRNIDVAVQYRNADLEPRTFERTEVTTAINPRRDEFQLDIPEREIGAGESMLFDVTVTNNLDQTVTDIEAKLFTNDPLDSDEDEGYIESLEPGESATITFELNADSGAIARTIPISMDFRYDDERGRSQTSDVYRVGIQVVDGDDDGFPWLLAGGLVVIGALAVYGYRRYRTE